MHMREPCYGMDPTKWFMPLAKSTPNSHPSPMPTISRSESLQTARDLQLCAKNALTLSRQVSNYMDRGKYGQNEYHY